HGVPITKYCDENKLTPSERLDLFLPVCQAIQHAHQKGIIHRDIKPSNILVTLHDGVPVPKVIDFGIAKATLGKLTDHTYFTALEQFVGTPAYMSPEQAEMSGLDIDTRSDIYSLGVLLYELLAGRPPFDPKTFLAAGLDEMRRLIREIDPPKPSVRLSTLTEADQTTVAKQRGTAPAQLSTELAGDLDWIVMRCIEKDRTRRYATPSELVADIDRHLRNEPVIARPPNTGYLLRKLVRRHRVGFAAGTTVAVSLIAGLVVSSVLLVKERAARERAVLAEATESRLRQAARKEEIKSAEVTRIMKDMLKSAGPSVALGQDTTLLRKIFDATAQRIGTELVDQPAIAADLRATLGEVYLDLGQHAVKAEPLLRAAVAGHRTATRNRNAETAASLTLWGQALRRTKKPAEAEAALQEALSIRLELFGPEHPLVADTLAQLASVPNRSEAEKEAMLDRVLAIRRKAALGDDHRDVATALYELGEKARLEVDHVAAMRPHEEALAIRRRLLGNEHPDTAASLDKLGYIYAHELDRKMDAAAFYAETFGLRRRLLDDAHPDTVVSLLRLTGQTPARDVAPETLDVVREFVASHRKRESVLLGPLLLVLASIEDGSRREPDAARARVQEARLILEQSQADAPLESDVVDAMSFFAWSKFVGNAPGEGLAMGEEAWRQASAAFGPASMPAVMSAHILAWLYMGLGRHDDAAGKFEAALNPAKWTEGFSLTLVDVAALGACYRVTNRVAESREFLATKLASLEANRGSRELPPQIALVRCQLGLTLLRAGRFAEAETVLRRALAEYDHPKLRQLNLRMHPPQRAVSGLGQALAGQGKFADADPLLVKAFEELKANEHQIAGNAPAMVREAHDAVIALYTAWGKPEKVAEWQAKLGEPATASR
ncbi:MAG: protein kinase domain-containing protein, partial [Opitutaceae bacterium]